MHLEIGLESYFNEIERKKSVLKESLLSVPYGRLIVSVTSEKIRYFFTVEK